MCDFKSEEIFLSLSGCADDENEPSIVKKLVVPNSDKVVSIGFKFLPRHLCPNANGVLFLVIQMEFNFRDWMPFRAHGNSFVWVRDHRVTNPKNGITHAKIFYLCVNSSRFPAKDSDQLEDVWLESRTQRSLAIAHEINYIHQHYLLTTPSNLHPTHLEFRVPSPSEDRKVVCPSKRINAYLNTLEREFSTQCRTVRDYNLLYGTQALDWYFRQWLKRGASRYTVDARTMEFLSLDPPERHLN